MDIEKIAMHLSVWIPIAMLILSLANSSTKHYTKFNGIIRAMMAFLERLSFLTSKYSAPVFKLPGTSVLPSSTIERVADVDKQLKRLAKLKKIGGRPLA